MDEAFMMSAQFQQIGFQHMGSGNELLDYCLKHKMALPQSLHILDIELGDFDGSDFEEIKDLFVQWLIAPEPLFPELPAPPQGRGMIVRILPAHKAEFAGDLIGRMKARFEQANDAPAKFWICLSFEEDDEDAEGNSGFPAFFSMEKHSRNEKLELYKPGDGHVHLLVRHPTGQSVDDDLCDILGMHA